MKIRKRLAKVKPSQLVGNDPSNPYAGGLVDETTPEFVRNTALIADVMDGRRPSHVRNVAVADLVVEQPPVLVGARRVVRENPSLVEILRDIRAGGDPWAVYRGEDGNLVMFDDYNAYAAAELDKVQRVNVVVYGEAMPDIETA